MNTNGNINTSTSGNINIRGNEDVRGGGGSSNNNNNSDRAAQLCKMDRMFTAALECAQKADMSLERTLSEYIHVIRGLDYNAKLALVLKEFLPTTTVASVSGPTDALAPPCLVGDDVTVYKLSEDLLVERSTTIVVALRDSVCTLAEICDALYCEMESERAGRLRAESEVVELKETIAALRTHQIDAPTTKFTAVTATSKEVNDEMDFSHTHEDDTNSVVATMEVAKAAEPAKRKVSDASSTMTATASDDESRSDGNEMRHADSHDDDEAASASASETSMSEVSDPPVNPDSFASLTSRADCAGCVDAYPYECPDCMLQWVWAPIRTPVEPSSAPVSPSNECMDTTASSSVSPTVPPATPTSPLTSPSTSTPPSLPPPTADDGPSVVAASASVASNDPPVEADYRCDQCRSRNMSCHLCFHAYLGAWDERERRLLEKDREYAEVRRRKVWGTIDAMREESAKKREMRKIQREQEVEQARQRYRSTHHVSRGQRQNTRQRDADMRGAADGVSTRVGFSTSVVTSSKLKTNAMTKTMTAMSAPARPTARTAGASPATSTVTSTVTRKSKQTSSPARRWL